MNALRKTQIAYNTINPNIPPGPSTKEQIDNMGTVSGIKIIRKIIYAFAAKAGSFR